MRRSTARAEDRTLGERRLCAAVFAASLLLYLSFRSLYFNFDGVACAIAVDLSDFKHLVHGNHLAYGVLAWLFDGAWRALGWRGLSLFTLQVLDGILGAAGAAVFASLLLRSGRSEREAALGGAALAVSQAWWFWSLEAQVYMLGALFAALAAREALSDSPRPLRLGLWHAAAVLGHVGHLMALPALAWRLAKTRGRRALLPYAAALGGAVAAAYLAAGVLAVKPRSFAELKLWLLGSAMLGTGRSFLWHSAPPLQAAGAWLAMTFRVFCEFAGRSGAAWAACALLAVLPVAAAARGARRGGERARFWLYWLAGYAALYLFWEPFTVVYRVSDLLGLWALAWLGLEELKPGARVAALAAWTAAAGAANWFFVVRPAADPAGNPDLVEAVWTGAHTPPDAWILSSAREEVYIPYFARRKALAARYLTEEDALDARLDALTAAGESVFVTDRTLRDAALRAALERYGMSPAGSGEGLTLYQVQRVKAGKASRKGARRRN
jgi:hypothetical protein